MSLGPEVSAAAAVDAYEDRSQSQVNKQKEVDLNGQRYRVFGYADDSSGFHGTAYQNATTGEIIIAYRGTDPDFKYHPLTMARDIGVDYTMVKDRFNPQEKAANDFTEKVLKDAQAAGISPDHVTLAGHSLGGALVEIEASKFHLRGMTINGYGAVDLGYGVPEGGDKVTNYVMAGDPVSAASRHYGQVVPLASDQDLAKLHDARYLHAPPGVAEPNPLLAMSLDDHSGTHFTGPNSVLKPENMAHAKQNYADNKVAIDHFRGDMYNSRAELALALNSTDHLNLESTYAHLSPRMQQQLTEYHAATVDPMVQNAVEHNQMVESAKHGLDQSSAAFQAGGQYAQHGADQVAQGLHSVGRTVQQRADEVSRGAAAFASIDPLAAGGVALGAKAAGYIAHVEAEAYAQASHLAGRAAHATGQFVAEQTQGIKHGVEQGIHAYAGAVQSRVHQAEAAIAHGIDNVSDAHARAEKMVDAVGHTYTEARQSVSHGIDATERAASQAYDTLTHPGQWFGHDSTPSQTTPVTAPMHSQVQAITPGSPTHARNDPRHPDNPDHALYNELHRRIPDASEDRLLQFTAACHTNKITADNLSTIHLDEASGKIGFFGSGFLSTPGIVDVNTPSPQPQQSIQHIQQHDQQQAQMMGQIQAQSAQVNQQGPTLGGP